MSIVNNDDGDDPIQAQLISLNEARLAMQRVVNEQKLILERHKASNSASSFVSSTLTNVGYKQAPEKADFSKNKLVSGFEVSTPLREATTTLSPIPSQKMNHSAIQSSYANKIDHAVLQEHDRKIARLKREYEDLQNPFNKNLMANVQSTSPESLQGKNMSTKIVQTSISVTFILNLTVFMFEKRINQSFRLFTIFEPFSSRSISERQSRHSFEVTA